MSETEPFRLRWIIECLGVNRTGSLLFVGQIPDEIYSHSKAEGIACYQVDTIEQAAAQFAQPHSGGESNHDDLLTLVLQVDPDEQQAARMLGHAIRTFPQRVVVFCMASDQSRNAVSELFYSLGFRRLQAPTAPTAQHDLSEPGCWFEYRMSQYKPAPEWLNARYWANPERFEVQEDPDGFCESSDDEEE